MKVRTSTLINRLETVKTPSGRELYYIDTAYGNISRFDAKGHAYLYECKLNRENIIDFAFRENLIKESEVSRNEWETLHNAQLESLRDIEIFDGEFRYSRGI